MEDLENIDKHLKQSLEDYSVQPRITSFDAVLKKLEKRKKRRFFIWILFPGIAVLGGLLFLGSFSLFNPNDYTERITNTPRSTVTRLKAKIPYPQRSTLPDKTITQSVSKTKKSSTPKNETKRKSSPNKTKKQKRESPVYLSIATKNNTDSVTPIANVIPQEPSSLIIVDITPELMPDRLEPIQKALMSEHRTPDSVFFVSELAFDFVKDSVISGKPKKKIKFLIGLDYTPQLSSYQYSKNKQYDDDGAPAFQELYRKNRKSQTAFDYNHSFGIKTGLIIKDKWELLFGFGYQRYVYKEKSYQLGGNGNLQSLGIGNVNPQALSNTNASTEFNQSKFSYFYYSTDASKYFRINHFMKAKAGVGLQINQLHRVNTIFVASPNDYYYGNKEQAPVSKWMCNVNVTMGFIQDLGARAQFHLSPGFFYSPNSMFNNAYVIKQKAYGFNLECLLLFRLGKISE